MRRTDREQQETDPKLHGLYSGVAFLLASPTSLSLALSCPAQAVPHCYPLKPVCLCRQDREQQEMDPQLQELYRGVGTLLARYKSGKLPKAFKIIPSLQNWQQVCPYVQLTSGSGRVCVRVSNLDARRALGFVLSRVIYGCTFSVTHLTSLQTARRMQHWGKQLQRCPSSPCWVCAEM